MRYILRRQKLLTGSTDRVWKKSPALGKEDKKSKVWFAIKDQEREKKMGGHSTP